ncbi:MAG: M50 family metallopeptidase [Planctomycetes bacterium]|nr:M50 family metallopeptidase [Planctomycetota bacterium]
MQAVHEAGHCLGAWLTGGSVARVVLTPWTFSRTDLASNPRPLAVAWAGPIVGGTMPALFWGAAALARAAEAFVLRFFAGFCLLANGLYLGLGSFDRVGDCGEIIRHGGPLWSLWLFGIAAVPPGLWLWHRQGRYFGLGQQREPIKPCVVYSTTAASVALLALALSIGGE